VAEAPGSFETEQGCGTSTVSREGHLLIIRDPIDPRGADRWDRGFVTKEALCRADPVRREGGPSLIGPPYPYRQWPEPTVSKLFSAVPVSSDSISRSSLLSVLDRQTAQATSRIPMTPTTP